jgi:hypothetical protein
MSSDDDQDEQAKAMADPYRQVFSILSLPPPPPTPSLTLRSAKPILCTFSAVKANPYRQVYGVPGTHPFTCFPSHTLSISGFPPAPPPPLGIQYPALSFAGLLSTFNSAWKEGVGTKYICIPRVPLCLSPRPCFLYNVMLIQTLCSEMILFGRTGMKMPTEYKGVWKTVDRRLSQKMRLLSQSFCLPLAFAITAG